MDGGFVYVMSTPSMPGIFKIGQTTNITRRRSQLSSSTSIPLPFTCDYKVFVQQHVEFEKALHKELEPFRVNESKEFFQCPLEIIKHAFQMAHFKRFGTECPAADAIPEPDPEPAHQPGGQPPETRPQRTAPRQESLVPTGDQLTNALQDHFGFSTFRPGQRQIIEQILAGKSSAAVFPTGSGKSLCYQLPALLLPGLTLVISPLIALMKDQIDALLAKGIQAARLDSTLTNNEYQDVMRGVRRGDIKLLYVAPERFMNERFRSAMLGIRISLFAVDEAHCVSEWGHNFRPDYLKLSLFARSFGAECVLALTATATPEVLEDICRSFDIQQNHAVSTGFYRPNLTLLTMPIEDSKRNDELLTDLRRQPAGPTIIYVTQQGKAEEVAQMLSENALPAKFYHAGMKSEDRTATQEWFIQSKAGIVAATIAFGMGIDKADIRYVYHYNLPKSLENYSQEVGRAGRDGLLSAN